MARRRPELPEHVLDAEKRKERGELNLDLAGQAKAVEVLARGKVTEVASRKRGVDGTWHKDLETGRMVRVVVRNGVLTLEED